MVWGTYAVKIKVQLGLPGFFVALIYPQNGDLTKLLTSARKISAPECPFECGGGCAKAIWAMPKCLGHQFEWGFP